jgi:hypothetical protein
MEIIAQSLKHIPVQPVEALTRMTVAEKTTPSFQRPVDLGDHLRDRYEGSLSERKLTDSLSDSSQGLGPVLPRARPARERGRDRP